MFGILQRTIFWELLKAFTLSLVALTGILLLAGIVAEASQRGLSPTQILTAIPLIMPSLMPYTIPSTTLFATCLVYGRLAHDNEIIAIKAAGINILNVVWPGVFLGVLTSVATLGLYYHVIPNTQYQLRTQFLTDVEEFLYAMLKNDRTINHPKLNYAIWVRQVQGRRLLEATFKRRDPRGQYDLVAWAREAELRVDSRNKQVLVHMRCCNVLTMPDRTSGYFEDRVWPVPMPDSPIAPQRERKAREMTLDMLKSNRVQMLDEMDDVTAELAFAMTRSAMDGRADDLALHRWNLDNKRKEIHRGILAIDVELYMRPSVACGCLCFALIGCPVGIWFSKRDYLSAFITCFLPIVLLYYPLLLCAVNLTRYGRSDPLLLWACNAVMLIAAAFLMRRLVRH